MKPLKTFTAVVFLVTFVFIFFSTLHLERTRRAKSDVLWYRRPTVHEGEVKASTQVRATTPNVGGGGFVLSGALLQPLSSVSRFIPVFPIDDVYTRMCLQAVGVSPEDNSGFKTFDIKEEDRENLCVHKNLILIHQRSPQQIKKLWGSIHNPFLTC